MNWQTMESENNEKCWIPIFKDTGEYLCIENGELTKNLLNNIKDPSSIFKFWTDDMNEFDNFWKYSPIDTTNINLTNIILIPAIWTENNRTLKL